MKVLSVVGNRPQFVKSGPVSAALRAAGIEEVGLHTGQHWDPDLSDVFYDELGLPEPRYRLDLHTADAETMRPAIAAALAEERPDWTLVFGDTNSTLAGAQAAEDAGVPSAHVEAGLRSGDLSMPEEHNRIAVDAMAELLLCPNERSRETLVAEGVSGRIEVVGDVMRDALDLFLPIATRTPTPYPQPYAVLTLHRAANTEPEQLRRIVSEVTATGWSFVFPIHPRTRHVLDGHGIRLAPTVRSIAPVGYLEMLSLVAGASRVVTDSGGLQKEAYWLGVPCITLRPSTEWVDTVRVGANVLVDPADPRELGRALTDARFPADAPPLYGDGHAAERVAASLADRV
ncbi:MAG TPA: UDP-N-acetyl glucosamine 2-epimerase [Gaiellaceae bacterium]|nr:UDP-N-acetyl glucosamine 2-epimerase [Gaiellaceae bacterium]